MLRTKIKRVINRLVPLYVVLLLVLIGLVGCQLVRISKLENQLQTASVQTTTIMTEDADKYEKIVNGILSNVTDEKATVFNSNPNAKNQVALLFETELTATSQDEGYIPQILDILKAKGVTATFSVAQNYLDKYPAIVQRMVNEGHLVINTNNDGRLLTGMNLRTKIVESYKATMVSDSTFFIPQGCGYDDETLRVAKAIGYTVVIPSREGRVWQPWQRMNPTKPEETNIRLEYKQMRAGDVFLLTGTREAVDDYIDSLNWFFNEGNPGYKFVTVEQLYNLK